MAQVTYLFGAGASANALPTYSNFRMRFKHFLDRINNRKEVNKLNNLQIDAEQLIDNCQRIYGDLLFHNSPDTIAKKYFHRDDVTINHLKATLIIYFLFEQTLDYIPYEVDILKKEKRVDLRYDALLSRILIPKKGFEIYSNFNILTWNYDFQFELSYQLTKGNITFQQSQFDLNSIPKVFEKKEDLFIDEKKFKVIHLNGLALNFCHLDEKKCDELLSFKDYNSWEHIRPLFELYSQLINPKENSISINDHFFFSWEMLDSNLKPDLNKHIYKEAIQVALQTEILVIVGYSFPDFNRAMDEVLLKAMIPNLRKIYLQSMEPKRLENIITNIFESDQVGKNLNIIPNFYESADYLNSFVVPHNWQQVFGANLPSVF